MENSWVSWAIARITQECPHPSPYLGSDDPVERALAKWCRQMRAKMKRGTLSPQEIDHLSSLPGWSWGRNADEEFQKKLQKWSLFFHMYGKAPRNHKSASAEEKMLHRWELRVQQYFREDRLPPHHYAVLNQLPGWRWKAASSRLIRFSERLQQWTDFVGSNRKHPSADNPDEAELARWQQRMVQQHAQGKLDDDKVQKLSGLVGWVWGDIIVEEAKKWSRWVGSNEGIFPSEGSMTNPVESRLGSWARNVRAELLAGRIDQQTTTKLMNVPHFQTFLRTL